MCGIAGMVRRRDNQVPPERRSLERMIGALAHRGPDEFGLFRDNRVGLVHTRLSIIDLASGQQPMCNQDQSLWLVFNGEIFNYVELRDELCGLGFRFRTQSDTEVLLHAFEAWDVDAFKRLNGQWAVALWQRRAKRLVLARDRVGVRPLFMTEHEGTVYFASEIKAMFAANPSIPRAFDPVGLAQTFTFWASLATRSVFENVTELPPGQVWSLKDEQWERKSYFEFDFSTNGSAGSYYDSVEETTERVHQAILGATALRMLRADVPVGSYLSGGLDSSFVAALGRQYAGELFHTFSLRFQDTEYDETAYQRVMVESIGSQHHEIIVSRHDIANAFPDVVFHAERPILRTAPAPLFLLSKLVRDTGIKVVLTGEGADEMFAGYDLFREGKVRRFWAKHPESTWRPRLLERLYPYLARSPVSQKRMAHAFFGRGLEHAQSPGFSHATRWQTTSALTRLFSGDIRDRLQGTDIVDGLLANLPEDFPRWSPLSQDQYIEIRTLLSGYLLSSQGDRMLMAHSVEGRFPFLDCNVMALATSLPDQFRMRGMDEKHILKRASVGHVPAIIRKRPKQPYRAPDALAFTTHPIADYVGQMLDENYVKTVGVFEPSGVKVLWNKCLDQKGNGQFSNTDNMALVGVLSTQLLHQSLICSHQSVAPSIPLKTEVDLCDIDKLQ